MIPVVAAGALTIHGLIHLIGFVVPWRIAVIESYPYRTTALNGALELGDAGGRLIGLAWLLLAVGFVAAAYSLWRGEPWALALTGTLAVASLVVCVLGLPDAAVGVAINVAILGALAWVAFLQPA